MLGLNGGLNIYAYVHQQPMQYVDPLGLAIGDVPPPPPGYDPRTWTNGTWPNGKTYLKGPDGTTYTMHTEDEEHWRHWDKNGPNGEDQGMCPEKSAKPYSNQKQPPFGKQSASDPNGDAAPWEAPQESPVRPSYPTDELPPIFVPPMLSPCITSPNLCPSDRADTGSGGNPS